MSSPSSCASRFRRLYVERGLRGSPYLEAALERLGLTANFVDGRKDIPSEHLNPASLFLCRPRGRALAPCPGSSGHLCCAYWTLDLYLGCTLGCSYCILRSYLNFAPVTVYLDPEAAAASLERLAAANPGRMVRVGTGEVGDSLELDPCLGLSAPLIRAAAAWPNLYLELKTKTDRVDHLSEVQPKGNAVIGFSLNPEAVALELEPEATLPRERLAAARRAAAAGFRLAFHFDPIVLREDSVEATLAVYLPLAESLAEFGGRTAWVSLGTFRYPSGLRDRLGDPRLAAAEMVPCRDGKFRYIQKERSRLYRELAAAVSRGTGAPVYLCMESAAVWRNVFGRLPREMPSLRGIFLPVHGGKR